MFLECQFPVRYQLSKQFLEDLRRIVYVQLINIQDTIHKSDFDIYQMIHINILPKLMKNQYMCGGSQNISSLSDISSPFPFLKTWNIASVKLIHLQDLMQKSDFNTYYATILFDLLEKLVGTNIWMFLEYQLPLRFYLLKSFLKNVRGMEYVHLINIRDAKYTQSTFGIYLMILINIPQKLVQNKQYVQKIIEYQLSVAIS